MKLYYIMADSRTRRKTPSRSRSSSRTRSPSRVDPDDIEVVLESKKKPTDRGNIFTRKNAKYALHVLGLASQPATTALDTAYNTLYRKRIKKGTKDNQVDPALDSVRSLEYEPAYPVIPDDHVVRTRRNGGKKKRKTQRKRKTRKNKK